MIANIDSQRYPLKAMEIQKNAVEILLGDKNSNKNNASLSNKIYKKSVESEITIENTIYNSKNSKQTIGRSLYDYINLFRDQVKGLDDLYECQGVVFDKNQIPDIDINKCNVLQAKDNVLTIEFGAYYKFVDSNGGEHPLVSTNENGCGLAYPGTETLKGNYDVESMRVSRFWNWVSSGDPLYIGLEYSKEEVNSYMKQAGIEPGFFTIKAGDHEITHFYSDTGTLVAKYKYDRKYQALCDGTLINAFGAFVPGDKFELDGKEYILKEDGSIDFPYGSDIEYGIKDPKTTYTKELERQKALQEGKNTLE